MNTVEQKAQKKNLVDHLKERKVQDFSYAILFLLVSSFFAFFVIRPVLSIAVALNREGEDLARINKVYEENISKVLQLQAELEELRPRVHVLNTALPDSPKVDALVQDIRNVAAAENITLDAVSIEGLQLKNASNKEELKPGELYGVKIDVSIAGSYEDSVRFVQALSQQRRIKTIQSVDIVSHKDPKASSSAVPASVKLKMNVHAYYL